MIQKRAMLVGCVMALSACQTVDTLDISTYAPAIDLYQYDTAQYEVDLRQCRELGARVQANYVKQREEEQKRATENIFAGILAGAVVGHVAGQNNDYHSGRAATAGALIGANAAASSDASAVDYSRILAKFGPSAVVDKCMHNRGYDVLSQEGFGGG